jgi:predicted NAD/FAD-binding protein
MKRVAVVGGGISGIAAAWRLNSERFQVTLFESESVLGGHAHTVEVSDPELGKIGVDMGFIVLNDKNYPNFHTLLRELNVPWQWSDMSFGYYSDEFCYAGTDWNGLFADRSNLLSPSFYAFFWELFRFCRNGLKDLEGISEISLGEYLKLRRVSEKLIRDYVLPMGSAIWSVSETGMLEYPARAFLEFFKNHGLLSLKDRPRWQTVIGGSRKYLNSFETLFRGEIRKSSPVLAVVRTGQQVKLVTEAGEESFDYVVIAVHGDQVLRLLETPTPREERVFASWRYSRNTVTLHTDTSRLPPNRRAWASWNYYREKQLSGTELPAISYHMNRLQGIKSRTDYIVTLNYDIPKEKVLKQVVFDHPIFTGESMATHRLLPELQGEGGVFFCGAYFGYGFHEDGCRAGMEVAGRINAL